MVALPLLGRNGPGNMRNLPAPHQTRRAFQAQRTNLRMIAGGGAKPCSPNQRPLRPHSPREVKTKRLDCVAANVRDSCHRLNRSRELN